MKEINNNTYYNNNSADSNDPFAGLGIHVAKLHEEKTLERKPDSQVINNILPSPLSIPKLGLVYPWI